MPHTKTPEESLHHIVDVEEAFAGLKQSADEHAQRVRHLEERFTRDLAALVDRISEMAVSIDKHNGAAAAMEKRISDVAVAMVDGHVAHVTALVERRLAEV